MTATGSISALRAERARYDRIRDAVAVLANEGYASELGCDLTGELEELGASGFSVMLTCLVCRQPEPVTVTVGDPDRTEPGAVICEACTAKVNAVTGEVPY